MGRDPQDWVQRAESGPEVRNLARELRRAGNDAEEALWRIVRNRRLLGLKFRRQHALGPFVADFYCVERRLVIEVDGGVHDSSDARARDPARDRWMAERGIVVLRMPADTVLLRPDEAVLAIVNALARSPASTAE